ncbi:TPA: hypothetical protein U2I45_001229 [Providencia rettgeri]|uniref:hypothetical protein n=1 Tax=Providencia TaxID=586 RepID=UPI001EFEA9AB|nr:MULTISPECIES: hypothetical protein [Providencia]MCG9527843.1 hypothetical protein [Providencia rettgeri]MCG9537360.1 hypothetical protein [Providencia huaxiensis]HEM6844619.1 hypothetical protein [Providencia rettgeri]
MSNVTSKSYKLTKQVISEIAELSKSLNIPQGKIIEDAIAYYTGHLVKNFSKQDDNLPFCIDEDFKPQCNPEQLNEIKNMELNSFIILKLKFAGPSSSYYCALKVTELNVFGGIAEFKGIRPAEAHKTFNTFDMYKGTKIAFRYADVCDSLSPSDIALRGGEERLYYNY